MNRRALCVGINAYRTSPLQGCVNDARDWAAELAGRGYDVDLLLDGFATKATLLERLAVLAAGARWGDRLVFTYSGHGTFVPDRDGDEPDRRDEALVSVDMRTVTDDELHNTVGRIPRGVRLTIVSDSCHSGTMARFVAANAPAHYTAAPRFLDPAHVVAEPTVKPRSLPARAMLLSGCADDEVSYDAYIGGRYRGAMTAAALEALPAATSMRDWHRRTLAALRYPQTPQLDATPYQRYRLRPFA